MCWMAPEPVISASVTVEFAGTVMQGDIFQPCPRSRAARAPVPSVAIPALPFSPVKFSALMDRVFAPDSREILCSPIPRPLKDVMGGYPHIIAAALRAEADHCLPGITCSADDFLPNYSPG